MKRFNALPRREVSVRPNQLVAFSRIRGVRNTNVESIMGRIAAGGFTNNGDMGYITVCDLSAEEKQEAGVGADADVYGLINGAHRAAALVKLVEGDNLDFPQDFVIKVLVVEDVPREILSTVAEEVNRNDLFRAAVTYYDDLIALRRSKDHNKDKWDQCNTTGALGIMLENMANGLVGADLWRGLKVPDKGKTKGKGYVIDGDQNKAPAIKRRVDAAVVTKLECFPEFWTACAELNSTGNVGMFSFEGRPGICWMESGVFCKEFFLKSCSLGGNWQLLFLRMIRGRNCNRDRDTAWVTTQFNRAAQSIAQVRLLLDQTKLKSVGNFTKKQQEVIEKVQSTQTYDALLESCPAPAGRDEVAKLLHTALIPPLFEIRVSYFTIYCCAPMFLTTALLQKERARTESAQANAEETVEHVQSEVAASESESEGVEVSGGEDVDLGGGTGDDEGEEQTETTAAKKRGVRKTQKMRNADAVRESVSASVRQQQILADADKILRGKGVFRYNGDWKSAMEDRATEFEGMVDFLFCDVPYNCLKGDAEQRDRFSTGDIEQYCAWAKEMLSKEGTVYTFCSWQQYHTFSAELEKVGLIVDEYPHLQVYKTKPSQGKYNPKPVVSLSYSIYCFTARLTTHTLQCGFQIAVIAHQSKKYYLDYPHPDYEGPFRYCTHLQTFSNSSCMYPYQVPKEGERVYLPSTAVARQEQKPIALYQELIRRYCKRGGLWWTGLWAQVLPQRRVP